MIFIPVYISEAPEMNGLALFAGLFLAIILIIIIWFLLG